MKILATNSGTNLASLMLWILLSICQWGQVTSFAPVGQVTTNAAAAANERMNPVGDGFALGMSSSSTTGGGTISTLTDETTWQLRFVLRGLPTSKGKKVDQIFNIQAQFIEEEGYEPPQGFLKQVQPLPATSTSSEEDDDDDEIKEKEEKSQFQIVSSRWLLSEDPNDRKDGLWVWGLFKEPLYPFLLLQLTTDSIPLPGQEGDSIEPLALFAQINHKRDAEKGAILSRAELKIREMETVKADLFGVSTAELYEEKTIGQCVFQPLVDGKPINNN